MSCDALVMNCLFSEVVRRKCSILLMATGNYSRVLSFSSRFENWLELGVSERLCKSVVAHAAYLKPENGTLVSNKIDVGFRFTHHQCGALICNNTWFSGSGQVQSLGRKPNRNGDILRKSPRAG